MFRAMRRTKQELTKEETEKILEKTSTGVLAVLGDNGYPYAVPLNFVYSNGAIYFHCAREGHKIDAIKANDKVSFTVVAKDAVVAEKFATDYYSAIAFGKAKILTEREDMIGALRVFNKKYSPQFQAEGEREIMKDIDRVCIVKIEIEHLTGKAAISGIRDSVNIERG